MLSLQGLNVSYGDSQVLWDVDLHVPAGRVVCLMGRNGVGKTTCQPIGSPQRWLLRAPRWHAAPAESTPPDRQ